MNIFQKKLIPNYLTIFRILMIPLIIFFMLYNSPHGVDDNPVLYHFVITIGNDREVYNIKLYWFLAGVCFAIASGTDFLDGYLARKYKWVSDWGKIWDPLADKILVNSVLILMGSEFKGCGQTIIFVPIIMIVRDIITDGYKMSAASKGIVVPANIFGKAKTMTQMIAMLVIFFVFCNTSNPGWNRGVQYYAIQNLLLFVATALSIISGIIYIVQITKKTKNHGQK